MVKTKKKFLMPSGIKNKMVAAIAMLLVSTILMVNSTYAWFTLSTAPEVTGITTSVGANGSLEIALLNADTYATPNRITTNVGDSLLALAAKNITWGNLIDLSDASYGLSTISLLPSRLTFENTGKLKSNILSVPVYGADGRVATLEDDKTITATYVPGADAAGGAWTNTDGYGVRAIGTDSRMTAQAAGLLTYTRAYNTAVSTARTTIQTALAANGNALSSAITTLAMDSNTATLTAEQQTAISDLVAAAGTSLAKIDEAYVNFLKAAASTIADETTYNAVIAAIGTKPLATAIADATAVGMPANSGITTASGLLTAQKTAVFEASDAVALGTDDGYKTALTKLINTTMVTVNGYAPSELVVDAEGGGKTVAPGVLNRIVADGGLQVIMPEGSGVFAYISTVTGNYSVTTTVDVNYAGLNLSGFNAQMKTASTSDNSLKIPLSAIRPASAGSTTSTITDTYGYAVDFAFRTNAASSYLKLQTEGINRVYNAGDTTAATQGAGSYMTFASTLATSGVAHLNNDQVKTLMGAIRVVFINPETKTVYGIATLDTTNATQAADGIKAALVLHEYSVSEGKLVVGGAKSGADAAKLVDLTQNTVHKLSVVVYLDGDNVSNGDVANAAQSLTGVMNLQFASSAELIPMENTALRNLAEETTAATEATTAATEATTAATEATTAAVGGAG